jgi:hypothetical protein
VTSAAEKLEPKQGRPRAATRGDDKSFRRQIRVGAIAIVIVNLAVGLFARQQQHEIIDYAVNVYDTAFISTNYVHLAQVAFQHYVDERLSAKTAQESATAGAD